MALTSKREVAQILRKEADSLRRHGFTNFFSHQYVCLLAQVLRPETCEGCLLGDYLPEEYRKEAFPCQHIDQQTWERIASIPGLPERVADRKVAGLQEEIPERTESEEEVTRTDQTGREGTRPGDPAFCGQGCKAEQRCRPAGDSEQEGAR